MTASQSSQFTSSLPGFSLLSILTALALIQPASAQTLRLGTLPGVTPVLSGSATVDGTGTQASGSSTFLAGATAATSTYKTLELFNVSTLNLGIGGVTNGVFNEGASTFNVNGGTINQVLAYDTSVTNINSGTITDLHQLNNSTVNVYGGTTTVFETDDNSTLDIFGTGLTETYLGSDPATATFPEVDGYLLTGTLQDGTALSTEYAAVGPNCTLLFNGKVAVPAAVPEASTTVSFGLLLALGLGGAVVAAKKKKAAV